tara:strand:- start:6493 stop:6711 length:219 start_codon:yes stop_codon:yes gene_type:complete
MIYNIFVIWVICGFVNFIIVMYQFYVCKRDGDIKKISFIEEKTTLEFSFVAFLVAIVFGAVGLGIKLGSIKL